MLATMLLNGMRFLVRDGAPPDAALMGCFWDDATGALSVTLQHESFEEVPEGEMSPLHHVLWEVERPQPLIGQRAITLRELTDALPEAFRG